MFHDAKPKSNYCICVLMGKLVLCFFMFPRVVPDTPSRAQELQ